MHEMLLDMLLVALLLFKWMAICIIGYIIVLFAVFTMVKSGTSGYFAAKKAYENMEGLKKEGGEAHE
jgi:hypothetical protein